MSKYIIQDTTLEAIGDAIREQTGGTAAMSPEEMVEEIRNNLGDVNSLVARTATDIKYNGVTEVAPFAFYRYSTLNSIELPACTTVGSSAFVSCTGLTSISLPNCTVAPTNAFASCTNIVSGTIGLSGTMNSNNFPYRSAKAKLQSISLPNCTSLSANCFSGYSSLKTIYAPECVSASTNVFTGCKSITNATIGFSELTSGNFPFKAASSVIEEVHFPKCTTIDLKVFGGNSSTYVASYPKLRVADFPACTYVSGHAFAYCSALTDVNLPVCSCLGSITYSSGQTPENVTGVFERCVSLTSISLPVCSYVCSYAFSSCASLVTVNLPACTGLGNYAFFGCDNLTSVNLPVCFNIQISAFDGCSSLISINLPSCIRVDDNAFGNCTNLVSVNLPMCSHIGVYAFGNCKSLSIIDLPACTFIDNQAFFACHSLTTLILGASSVVTLNGVLAPGNNPIVNSIYTGSFGSVYVPASLVSAYKVASAWSDIADRITAIT